MISARLVGDDRVLGWLRATPDAVISALTPAITRLGIDLQRRALESELTGRAASFGSFKPNVDLHIDEGGDGVAATVSSGTAYARARENDSVRASLHRIKKGLGARTSKRAINIRSYRRRAELPEQSFLRSVLEEMGPEIRDSVEEAVREALKGYPPTISALSSSG